MSRTEALEAMRSLTVADRGWVIQCLEADRREEEWDRHRELMAAQEASKRRCAGSLGCPKAPVIKHAGKVYCASHAAGLPW